MREIDDILHLYERRKTELFVIATLVGVRGSSYRRPGARMLIAPGGETAGSLSGGCLEVEVAQRAERVARTGVVSRMAFDTRRRFGCNGEIEIFLEPAQPGFLRDLALMYHARKQCRVVTIFEEEMDFLGSRLMMDMQVRPDSGLVQVIDPPIQLVIVGETPDTTALRCLSLALGWRVINADSVPELDVSFDEWTAVLIETHHYGRDFAALSELMPRSPRYLGLVGSRRRRDQLLADLMDAGVQLDPNLFAPAGLDLGADSPEQIALAIVAEIQAVFAGGSCQFLRDRRVPIHEARQNTALTLAVTKS